MAITGAAAGLESATTQLNGAVSDHPRITTNFGTATRGTATPV